MVSRKISISVPEELLRKIDEAASRARMSRSELISRILEERLGEEGGEAGYPTVLWKIRTSAFPRFRSPRNRGRRVGSWVLEEVEE